MKHQSRDPSDPYAPPRVAESASEPPTSARYILLFALLLAATIAYMGRNCLGVAVADEGVQSDMQAMGVPSSAMSWVMFAFFIGYALAQIPSGWLGHVWGVRWSLSLFAVVWSLACAAIGTAQGLWSLIGFQVAFGIAQAGIFPCSAAAISQWLPASRRAFASGTLGSFMSIGGAIGVAVTGLAIDDQSGLGLDWRWVFAIFALPGVVWGGWFYVWYRNRPEEHRGVNSAELRIIQEASPALKSPKTNSAVAVPWASLLTSFDMWMICAQQFFRAAGYIFFATWFPTFLTKEYDVDTAASGYLTALPFLGVVAGGIVGGLIVDWIWNRTGSQRLSRQAVAVTGLLGCAAFIALAYFISQPVLAVVVISAGMFSFALSGSCGYAVTIDKAGPHVAPVFGAMNMCGNLGAAICPVVVKWIAGPTDQWSRVLIFFALIYVGAAICWMLFNPEGPFTDGTKTLDTSNNDDT